MNKFIEYIIELFNQGFGIPLEYWLVILISILLIFGFGVKVITKFDKTQSLYFGINLSSVKLLSCILGITLLSVIILFVFFYHEYFIKLHYALDFILIIFSLSLSLLIVVFNLSKGVRSKLPKYIKPPLSIIEKTQKGNYITNEFNKSKWRILCLLLPFFLLLFHSLIKQEAEVSILIDNSGSTDMYREYGQKYLAKAVDDIYDETRFNITYFETFDEDAICKMKYKSLFKDVNKIIRIRDNNKLSGTNYKFNSNNELSNFISNNEIEHSCLGTPLIESLWSNYLYTISNSSKNKNSTKVLILLTDGLGNLYYPSSEINIHTIVPDDFDIFEKHAFTNDISMYDYYDEIAIINIGDNYGEALFANFTSNIYDGQDEDSYKQSLKSVTNNIKKQNWNFIYIIAFLSIITVVILLSTTLRPIYKQNS